MQDILTFVHANPRGKKENLATEVLAYLLSQAPGQRFIQSFLQDCSLAYGSKFIDPVTQERVDTCIPDIRLKVDGQTVAQLELKFDARLTDAQAKGHYFKHADVTFFIAPEYRVADLRQQLEQLNVEGRFEIVTWNDFIARMFAAVRAEEDPDSGIFKSALHQYRSFCDVIEQEQFVPFSSQQLAAPQNYSSERHLVWLTREMLAEVKRNGSIPEGGSPQPGMDDFFYFGQNIEVKTLKVWFGYWPKAWKTYPSKGPLWAWVKGGDTNKLLQTLRTAGAVIGDDKKVWVPLLPPTEQVCATQVDELNRLIRSFNAVWERILESIS